MKNSISLLLLLLPFLSIAQQPQVLKSEISQVTVYLDGAIVTRKSAATLSPGTYELVFNNLPPGLAKDLIAVKANAAVRLLEVNYRSLSPEERGLQSVAHLQEAIEKQHKALELLRLKKQAREADLNFLQSKSLYKNQDNPTPQQFKEMDAYIATRRDALLSEVFELNEKIAAGQKRLQKEVAEIQRITAENFDEEMAIVIRVDVKQAGKAQFDISYFSAQAGWTPTYNIRVDRLDAPVAFEMVAQVDQATGEDWSNVQLQLSTGNPSLGGSMPEMNVWTLMQQGGYMPRKLGITGAGRTKTGTGSVFGAVQESGTGLSIPYATVRVVGSGLNKIVVADAAGIVKFDDLPEGSYQISAESLGYSAYRNNIYVGRGRTTNLLLTLSGGAVLMENVIKYDAPKGKKEMTRESYSDAEMVANTVRGGRDSSPVMFVDGMMVSEEQFTTLTYTIDKPYSIKGNGMPVAIQVNTATIPASFTHIVRPALDDNAFLVGKIVNWQDLRLLKGKSQLFFEGVYMGESVIDPLQTKDTLQLSLGRDPQVIVKRERVNKKESRSFFGGTQKHEFAYKIEIRNNKKLPINLVLQDQLPLSGNKEITVGKPIIGAGGAVETETGYITWRKTLAPATNADFDFSFDVNFPSSWRINLPY